MLHRYRKFLVATSSVDVAFLTSATLTPQISFQAAHAQESPIGYAAKIVALKELLSSTIADAESSGDYLLFRLGNEMKAAI